MFVSLLNEHYNVVHLKLRKKQTCSVCKKEVFRLSGHMKLHAGIEYRCQLCTYKTNTAGNLKDHIIRMHSVKNLECKSCNYKSAVRNTLKLHELQVHGEKSLQCPSCVYKTSRAHDLKRHIEDVHNTISK